MQFVVEPDTLYSLLGRSDKIADSCGDPDVVCGLPRVQGSSLHPQTTKWIHTYAMMRCKRVVGYSIIIQLPGRCQVSSR